MRRARWRTDGNGCQIHWKEKIAGYGTASPATCENGLYAHTNLNLKSKKKS